MSRQIVTHVVGGVEAPSVLAVGDADPDAGEMTARYSCDDGGSVQDVQFRDGRGGAGWTDEALLSVLVDRLQARSVASGTIESIRALQRLDSALQCMSACLAGMP